MNKSILFAGSWPSSPTAPVLRRHAAPRTRAKPTSAPAFTTAWRVGELTRPEARRLRAGQVHLHRAEARAKSDGVVTGRERARLQHEANQQSRRIYRQKHDAQDRG